MDGFRADGTAACHWHRPDGRHASKGTDGPFAVSGQRAEETYEGGKSRICLFTEFLNYLNGYGEISERREEKRQTARGMAGICMRDGRKEKE